MADFCKRSDDSSRFVEVGSFCGIRDSSVGIATGYGLDGRGSISGGGKRFFCTPQHPDRLLGRSNLLSNGHRGLFPRR
jgi:hypothetical protein